MRQSLAITDTVERILKEDFEYFIVGHVPGLLPKKTRWQKALPERKVISQ